MAILTSETIPDDLITKYVLDKVKKDLTSRVMEIIRADVESIVANAMKASEAKVESVYDHIDRRLTTRAHFTWEVNNVK